MFTSSTRQRIVDVRSAAGINVFAELQKVPLGFEPDRVLTVDISTVNGGWDRTAEDRNGALREWLVRRRGIAVVVDAVAGQLGAAGTDEGVVVGAIDGAIIPVAVGIEEVDGGCQAVVVDTVTAALSGTRIDGRVGIVAIGG